MWLALTGVAAALFAGEGRAGGVIKGGGPVKAPEKLRYVAPAYPEAACAARLEGDVHLRCTRTQAGQVKDCRVVRGIAELNGAAIDAVQQWIYKPRPADVAVDLTISFRLRDSGCRGQGPSATPKP